MLVAGSPRFSKLLLGSSGDVRKSPSAGSGITDIRFYNTLTLYEVILLFYHHSKQSKVLLEGVLFQRLS